MDNNNDLNSMLSQVLENPEAMKGVMELAGSLMNNNSPQGNANQNSGGGNSNESGDDRHIKLLNALKPYLNNTRREKADQLLKIMKLMKAAGINNLDDINGLLKKLNL